MSKYIYPFKPGQHVRGTQEGSYPGLEAERKAYVVCKDFQQKGSCSTLVIEKHVLNKQVGRYPPGTICPSISSYVTDWLEIVPGSAYSSIEAVQLMHIEILRLYDLVIEKCPVESLIEMSPWLTLPDYTLEQVQELLPQMYEENRRLADYLFVKMPLRVSKPPVLTPPTPVGRV